MRNGMTRVPLITRERLNDMRRSRVLVEGTVTEWASPRLDTATLDRLEQLADEITQARRTSDGVPASLEKNRIFHFTIYAAAESPVMMAMIESLWLQSGAYLRDKRELLHSAEQPPDLLHESTIEAIRRGELVAVLGDYEWPVNPAYAVYPPTRHLSRRAREFIDFLAEYFSGTPSWDKDCASDS